VILLLFGTVFCCGFFAFILTVISRNAHIWLPGLLFQFFRTYPQTKNKKIHIYFCLADHFEPYWKQADKNQARTRVRRWLTEYPECAENHSDSFGNKPKHTFFYPIEEYDHEILDGLSKLCKNGFGDVEIHLHHDHDTESNLARSLQDFSGLLNKEHGLLRKNLQTGAVEYAFIHGNWALDNSRPDKRWCGVDNELSVLSRTGCYMDMTLPSAPGPTQTRKINSIYFAQGKDKKRKSHNHGRDVAVGSWRKNDDELLLVQGPLALNFKNRKFGIFPRLETGELSADAPPSPDRIDIWFSCKISVIGAENHIFIKTFTHGAQEKNSDMFFSGGFDTLWTSLEKKFRDRNGFSLHYVTAREMYEQIRTLAHSAKS
jgi:hypothetical protein